MKLTDALHRLGATDGDLQAMTLAALDIALESQEPTLRPFFAAAAIPHWFDARILATVMGCSLEEATGAVEKLRTLPMVETFPARTAWNVHEATRLALRDRMARRERLRLESLSARAAAAFAGDELHMRAESVFHLLVANPGAGAEMLRHLKDDVIERQLVREAELQHLAIILDELLHAEVLAGVARAQTLLVVGWIRRNEVSIPEALRLAEAALAASRALEDQPREADALVLLGTVLESAGENREAQVNYRRSRELMEKVVAADPSRLDHQYGLFDALAWLGQVLKEDPALLDEALQTLELARSVMNGLLKVVPASPGWRRSLAVINQFIGDILAKQDRLDEALARLASSRQVLVSLRTSAPRDPDLNYILRNTDLNTAMILERSGRADEALGLYEESLKNAEMMHELYPQSPERKHELANALIHVAGTLDRNGIVDRAVASWLRAADLIRQLASDDPERVTWLADSIATDLSLANHFRNAGQVPEARRHAGQALAVAERMAVLSPDSSDARYWLGKAQDLCDVLNPPAPREN